MDPSANSNLQPINQTSSNSTWTYALSAVLLLVGLLGGYFLSTFWTTKTDNASSVVPVTTQSLTLPSDAVLIQDCASKKGALYILPKNIPIGPVYMVNNNKVIGIEYMLSKDEFLSGKSFTNLESLGVKVDHVNVGLLSQGHAGYQIPHYHVDLYIVDKAISEAIACPTAATPSATTK